MINNGYIHSVIICNSNTGSIILRHYNSNVVNNNYNNNSNSNNSLSVDCNKWEYYLLSHDFNNNNNEGFAIIQYDIILICYKYNK